MRPVYLILAITGYALTFPPMLQESLETGNWLFWLHPKATYEGWFANRIATTFALDLLVAVVTFFIWSYFDGKRLDMPRVWLYWLLTLLFGLGGTLPLFLYFRERHLQKVTH